MGGGDELREGGVGERSAVQLAAFVAAERAELRTLSLALRALDGTVEDRPTDVDALWRDLRSRLGGSVRRGWGGRR